MISEWFDRYLEKIMFYINAYTMVMCIHHEVSACYVYFYNLYTYIKQTLKRWRSIYSSFKLREWVKAYLTHLVKKIVYIYFSGYFVIIRHYDKDLAIVTF